MSHEPKKPDLKNPHGLTRFGESVRELMLAFGMDVASNKHALDKLKEMCSHVKDVPLVLLLGLSLRVALWCALVCSVAEYVLTGHVSALGVGTMAGIALDVQSFTVIAPGAAGTAMTPVVGDPANVKNATDGSKIQLVAGWCKAQLTGSTVVSFPSGNDQTRNINWINAANIVTGKIPLGSMQPMRAQDLLSLTQIGSVTALDVELVCLQMWYEDLPGVSSQLITADALAARTVRLVTIRQTVTPTVASTYSGSIPLNTAPALLQGNTPYAVLGAEFNLTSGALCIRGPDTGNLRCAIPCMLSQGFWTGRYFVDLAEGFKLPMIPTFNSANLGATFAEVLSDENLGPVPFSMTLAQLTP